MAKVTQLVSSRTRAGIQDGLTQKPMDLTMLIHREAEAVRRLLARVNIAESGPEARFPGPNPRILSEGKTDSLPVNSLFPSPRSMGPPVGSLVSN